MDSLVMNLYDRLTKACDPQPVPRAGDCQTHTNLRLLDAIPQELIVKVLEKVDAGTLNAFFRTCHEGRAFKDSTELQVQWLRHHLPGTALLRACRTQRPLAAVRLLQHADLAGINAVDKTKSTPLHHACMSGLVDVVAGLVRREGLEINALDALKRTPLTIASKAGHKAVVELLCGVPFVDFNRADCEGENPLLAACSEGHIGIVELLLRQAPTLDVMARMVDHAHPLYLAACKGHCDVVHEVLKAFAEFGASVNMRGPHRSTALHAACEQGHTQVVELLLGVEGIDKQALNRSSCRPIDLAMKHPKIVKLLLDHKDTAPSVAMDEEAEPSTTPESGDFGLWNVTLPSEDAASLE